MTLLVVSISIFLLAYALYIAILPRPIRGIPHNANTARRILGDVPNALAYQRKHQEMSGFLTDQLVKLDHPVIQLFLRPFGRPWVVVSDFREAQDVMLRRTREFDRSDFFSNLFTATLPTHQVRLKMGVDWKVRMAVALDIGKADNHFRHMLSGPQAHRRLTADTMSHQFLHDTVGPLLFESLSELLLLWRIKARLAQGRPFSAKEDVKHASLDTIFAATFGSNAGVTAAQANVLSSQADVKLSDDLDRAVIMPAAVVIESYESIVKVADSSGIPLKSPFPLLHHWLAVRLSPSLRKAIKKKNELIHDRLSKAWNRYSSAVPEDFVVECALDLMLQREAHTAAKEGRLVEYVAMRKASRG